MFFAFLTVHLHIFISVYLNTFISSYQVITIHQHLNLIQHWRVLPITLHISLVNLGELDSLFKTSFVPSVHRTTFFRSSCKCISFFHISYFSTLQVLLPWSYFSQYSLLDVIEEAEINIINNAWRWRLHDQYCEVVEYLTSSLHGNLHSWLILTNNILEDYWFPLCCGFNKYFYQHLTAFQTWLVTWYFSNCPDNKTLSRNSLNGNWLQLRWKRLHKYRQPCTLPYNLNL